MRLRIATGTAIVALTIALQGCASTPEPDPLAELNPTPEEDDQGLAFVGPQNLEAAIVEAQMLRRAGDYQGAVRTVSQLVLVAPDDPRVLGEYGKTLVAQGQTEDAIAFLSRAIELSPGDWTLYSAQGVAFDQARNYTAAGMAYNRALTLRPGEPTVLSNAGLSRMQAGDLDNAEMLFNEALAQGGTDPRIASNLVMVQDMKAARAAALPGMDAAPTANPVASNAAREAPLEPADSAPLPGAVERNEIPAPTRRTSDAAQALAADPTVMMQRIPEPDPIPEPVAAPAPDLAPAIVAEVVEEDEAAPTEASTTPRALSEQVTADASEPGTLRRLSPTD